MQSPYTHIIGALVLGITMGTMSCGEPPIVIIKPLRVVHWSPNSGSVCVDTVGRIELTFSDDIVVGSLSPTTFQLLNSDGVIDGSISYDKASFTATLSVDPLDYARLYSIRAGKQITSTTQGPLPSTLESSFLTVGRLGCTPVAACERPSDCDLGQWCSSVGNCIDECVTTRDCPNDMECVQGTCT